jgi:hypothetical protein
MTDLKLATSQDNDGKYYVGRPWKGVGWPSLADARGEAAIQQANGHVGSLVIYRDGKPVDMKRY